MHSSRLMPIFACQYRKAIMRTTFMKSFLAVALAIFSSEAAMGQEKNDNQKVVEDLLSRIELNGYAQAGYEYLGDGDAVKSTFNLKRTLLWGKAKVTDRWSFLFMHDFNSEVQEFYMDYRISKGKELSVRVGQFKNSYSMENPLSPTRMELIDVYSQAVTYLSGCGSDPLNGVNYGRDLGLMVFGDLLEGGRLHYELAIMNGQGINQSDGNTDKDIIVKLEYKLMPELRLVASGQKGRGHAVGTAEWNPTIEIGDDYARDRLSLGGEWKADRLGLHGEWLWGKDGRVKSWGSYLTGCYTIADNLDIVASADFFDRNTRMAYDQLNLTAGIQYWFYKKCRVQLQYTRQEREFDADCNCLQAQVQVAF